MAGVANVELDVLVRLTKGVFEIEGDNVSFFVEELRVELFVEDDEG